MSSSRAKRLNWLVHHTTKRLRKVREYFLSPAGHFPWSASRVGSCFYFSIWWDSCEVAVGPKVSKKKMWKNIWPICVIRVIYHKHKHKACTVSRMLLSLCFVSYCILATITRPRRLQQMHKRRIHLPPFWSMGNYVLFSKQSIWYSLWHNCAAKSLWITVVK